MLYAASVRVRSGKVNRRIDVIIEADDLDKAKEKALKQARNIYAPDKKATYAIIGMINEVEAFENFSPLLGKPELDPNSP
jgi:hypothetical protein